MADTFVSLAAIVRGARVAPIERACEVPAQNVPAVAVAGFAHADLVHELALMRLAAVEAFERGTSRLLRILAHDVLARELTTAPADIEALANRALAAYSQHEPLEIVVSPADAERVRAALPTRADAALEAGDLIVNVRDGAFESTFDFRLEAALARASERSDA